MNQAQKTYQNWENKHKTHGNPAFMFAAPKLWNTLPLVIHSKANRQVFWNVEKCFWEISSTLDASNHLLYILMHLKVKLKTLQKLWLI